MNDIFSDMQSRINVSYISDLPYHKHRVLLEMKRMNLSIYTDGQLEDFSYYVFKIQFKQWYYVKKKYQLNRNFSI